MKSKDRGLPLEQLEHFYRETTPETRLKWLEEAVEFVKKFVYPQHKHHWDKTNNKASKN